MITEETPEEIKTEKPAELFPEVKKKSFFNRKKTEDTIQLDITKINDESIAIKNVPTNDSSLILITKLSLPLWRMIFMPIWTVNRFKEESKTSYPYSWWSLIIKWSLIGLGFAMVFHKVFNLDPFSYARMNFTDAAWLWMRVFGTGIITELFIILLITVVYHMFDKTIMLKHVMLMQNTPNILIGLFIGLSLITMRYYPYVGTVLLLGSITTAVKLHDNCYVHTENIPDWLRTLTIFISYSIGAFCIMYFIHLFGQDMILIFRAIFNL